MKLLQIISEISFNTYVGMIQVVFDKEEMSASKIAELIRALPGITTVTLAGSNDEGGKVTLKVKLISQKSGQEAFQALKSNALTKYSPIKVVTVGDNTIEKK